VHFNWPGPVLKGAGTNLFLACLVEDRISFHLYNDEGDIDNTVQSNKKILQTSGCGSGLKNIPFIS